MIFLKCIAGIILVLLLIFLVYEFIAAVYVLICLHYTRITDEILQDMKRREQAKTNQMGTPIERYDPEKKEGS